MTSSLMLNAKLTSKAHEEKKPSSTAEERKLFKKEEVVF